MFDHLNHPPPAQVEPPPPPQKVVRWDKGYITTTPGILKLVQLASNILGFICIKVSWGVWISSVFYNILYWLGMIITGGLLLVYSMHFVEKFDHWPWLKFEFFYCSVVVLVYFVLSIIATTLGESVGYAVSFFGLCAVIAYGMDAYLKYKAWKRGLPPQ